MFFSQAQSFGYEGGSLTRKIVHIDMDAFYASVEQRDHPEYRGKPVIVGGKPDGRGVVCAASYEARKFGVRSAMPSFQAGKRCPKGIFLAPRFQVYRAVSQQIMAIFRTYTDLVEPLSLDEAYLDVTHNKKGIELGRDVALAIRKDIFERTDLTASAGIAPNKFLAKIASDMRKPNGQMVIAPSQIPSLLPQLAVRKVPGIGRVTEKKMQTMGIFTIGDLQQFTREQLIARFGKVGAWYYRVARGEDDREVKSHRKRKSVGIERTYSKDLLDLPTIYDHLQELSFGLLERLQKNGYRGRTLTLKITYANFVKVTRSKTLTHVLDEQNLIYRLGRDLLGQTEAGERPIRLLGLSSSNEVSRDAGSSQMAIF